ncbi:MAG TPA: hypothetical protein VHE30_26030 [Polyangiaceae bacterium]|nr:hypothetical protein [Polyangiaceae bacterium]
MASPARVPRRTGNTGPAVGLPFTACHASRNGRTSSGTASVTGAGFFFRVFRRTKVHVANPGPKAVHSSAFRSPARMPPMVRERRTSILISPSTSGWARSFAISSSVSTTRGF